MGTKLEEILETSQKGYIDSKSEVDEIIPRVANMKLNDFAACRNREELLQDIKIIMESHNMSTRNLDTVTYREILCLLNSIPELDEVKYAMDSDDYEQTMTSVCKLHQAFIRPGGDLSFLRWTEKHPNTFASRKFNQIRSSSTAEKMWSSIEEFVNRALEPFEFEEARRIFENGNCIDIQSLGRKKTVLFLNVSDTDRTFDQLANVFYTQTLQQLCSLADSNEDGRLEVPVRIIMDDFASSARIPDFDKVISVIRSREISVSLILQSMTQLESMYTPAEAKTIVNNCDHLLYLGSQDIETAEFIGCRSYKQPEAVLCMPRNSAVLMTSGEKARVVKKIMPYSTLKG